MLTNELTKVYIDVMRGRKRTLEGVVFAIHWQLHIYRLAKELEAYTYEPTVKAFFVFFPRLREVFAGCMEQRIIDNFLDVRLRPLIERHLTDRTFNNRVGYGASGAINTVISDIYDVSKGFTADAWIIKVDILGYFPNANQDIAYRLISDIVENEYHEPDKDIVRQLLLRSVYSYPTHHCKRLSPPAVWEDYPKDKSLFSKPDGVGAVIGALPWQILMGLYCNHIDHAMVNEYGFHYVRFVDDMTFVTDNKEAMLRFIPTIRSMLADVGCTLHPKKFYCQHYTKGVEFLGSVIKKDRVYVTQRIVRSARGKIKFYNSRAKLKNLDSFLATMNSYLGIFKGRNAYKLTMKLLGEVNPTWWRYCHLNRSRMCLQANPGYTFKDNLTRKYGVKFKTKNQNEHKRKNRGARGREARTPRKNGGV